MNEIQSALLAALPPRQKATPSGWTSFNAVCCHNNGEKRDTRKRGGVLTNPDGGFQYHCFNCNFKAGWTPGKLFSQNTRRLFQWMGMGEADIGKLNLIALKLKDNQPITKKELKFELEERGLPEECRPIDTWIAEGAQDTELLNVIQYLVDDRRVGWNWYNWHWSAAPGYRDRVVIPFYQNGKIVGYTARKITEGKPKYLTDAQPGYVFNIDAQHDHKEYVILVEGQFDAIAIEGCAVMHNEPNETQCSRINALGREVIVVPDKDKPGAKMLKAAIDNKWSASLPPWEDNIKDVADAVKRYGRLYVLSTILHYKVQGEINLHLLKKKLESLDE
jgi:hypothetical protein